jgi:hypothetical protein
MVDPAAVGESGRNVRCARCKTAWFASAVKPVVVAAFVEDVIAEAEARSLVPTPVPVPVPAEEQPPAAEAPVETPTPPQDEVAEFSAALAEPSADPAPVEPLSPAEPLLPAEPALADESTALVPAGELAVEIREAPALAPLPEAAPPSPPPDAEAANEDIESFAARRARLQASRRRKRASARITMCILALIGVNAALIGWRADVVRAVPQTASLFAAIGLPVNLRGLVFEDIKIASETHDGVNVLVVDGNIVSASGKPVEVPRLRFAVRNATSQEVYSWTAQPTRSILGPGERLAFRSRLASPPADAKDVLVRFFNRRDVVAEAK